MKTVLRITLLLGLAVIVSCSAAETVAGPNVEGGVALSISKVTATRNGRYVYIMCFALIDNQTGSELTVQSSFFSAFDGLSVLVRSADGKTLGKTSFLLHQSPASWEPRDFPLPSGKTGHRLVFISDVVTPELTEIVIEVIGDLPGSGYDPQLRSNSVTVEVT